MANRRFVPFYFDLSNRGVAGDADARKFVVKQRKRLGGRGVPTPPVLFMSPEGKVLGEVSNYASEEKVLEAMLRVLEKHPEFTKPAKGEAKLKGVAKAELCIDLQDYDGARKALADVTTAQAHYLRGRLARFGKDWKAAEASFSKVKTKDLLDDVRMELALKQWQEGEYEELEKQLSAFPKNSNRYTQARYYLGLAKYYQDEKKAALAIWRDTIKSCNQDPWIYRADWAYSGAKQTGRRKSFSSRGKRTSLLNRIGYMGRRNPDLAR